MRLSQQPCSSIDIARHAFSRAAPTVCNNLPVDSLFADLFMNFRSLLLTFTDLLLISLGYVSPGPQFVIL